MAHVSAPHILVVGFGPEGPSTYLCRKRAFGFANFVLSQGSGSRRTQLGGLVAFCLLAEYSARSAVLDKGIINGWEADRDDIDTKDVEANNVGMETAKGKNMEDAMTPNEFSDREAHHEQPSYEEGSQEDTRTKKRDSEQLLPTGGPILPIPTPTTVAKLKLKYGAP